MKRDRIPNTLSKAPRLVDADSHRNHLTEEERFTRMCIAVHEAAHFVVACRINVRPYDAYVRVPRKAPKCPLFKGLDGSVRVNESPIQNAVVAAAGLITQACLPNWDKSLVAVDDQTIEDWKKEDKVTIEYEYAVLDAVRDLVRREWAVIDAVAACLLFCSDATGHLSPKYTSKLFRLVAYGRQTIRRTPYFDTPTVLSIDGAVPRLELLEEFPWITCQVPAGYRSELLDVSRGSTPRPLEFEDLAV